MRRKNTQKLIIYCNNYKNNKRKEKRSQRKRKRLTKISTGRQSLNWNLLLFAQFSPKLRENQLLNMNVRACVNQSRSKKNSRERENRGGWQVSISYCDTAITAIYGRRGADQFYKKMAHGPIKANPHQYSMKPILSNTIDENIWHFACNGLYNAKQRQSVCLYSIHFNSCTQKKMEINQLFDAVSGCSY